MPERNLFLEESFYDLFFPLCPSKAVCSDLFDEIKGKYDEKHRFYHNSRHIENMLRKADELSAFIHELKAVKVAIWFHDVVYEPFAKNNEEKSAEFAARCLEKISAEGVFIETVCNLIKATAKHEPVLGTDFEKFFLDIDLAVLASPPDIYDRYSKNVRREYGSVPDFVYYPARKKIMQNFLKRESIYFTNYFRENSEASARRNIERELAQI
jgi:predicted metal-dependent HD superfamily phosphohydrolase